MNEKFSAKTLFLAKHGTEGWLWPIEEFIRRSPPFQGDEHLATMIGVICNELTEILKE